MRPGERVPSAAEVQQAMDALNPLERQLWAPLIRNGLTIPTTRLVQLIPRYGIKAATQIQVALLWLAPATLWVVGYFFYLVTPAPIDRVGFALIAVGALCILFAAGRMVTYRQHARAWRESIRAPQNDMPRAG
jgi:membrane protein YdbS with pleckstrin-like domain